MSLADLLAIGTTLISGLVALRFGFLRVMLGLAGWVGSIMATIYGFAYAHTYTRDWINNELIADIVAGAGIFVASMIVLTIISRSIARGVRQSSFGMLDRTFGLLAGLVIGSAIVIGAYTFTQQVLDMTDESPFLVNARTLPLLRRGAAFVASGFPAELGLNVPGGPATNVERTFQQLLSPKPESTGSGRDSGYRPEERREMNRLIRNHQ
ncbi:MAG: CvpA family protein [Pseudomonadota bacterium]|nr:CvpA family protein [Pseudomonadota bacterium]